VAVRRNLHLSVGIVGEGVTDVAQRLLVVHGDVHKFFREEMDDLAQQTASLIGRRGYQVPIGLPRAHDRHVPVVKSSR
jgi:hypothetical protein